MISYLRGEFIEAAEDSVIVEICGVGYEVFMTQRAIGQMPSQGEPALLFTHDHYAREGERSLFGFLRREERALFQDLINVSGVGARSALAILSILTPEELVTAVQNGDAAAIARAKGVGKKTAQRAILDMQNRWGALRPLDLGSDRLKGAVGEAVEALEALGAERLAAEQAALEAQRVVGKDAPPGELVRAALQAMERKR